jgi:hypothetical protein
MSMDIENKQFLEIIQNAWRRRYASGVTADSSVVVTGIYRDQEVQVPVREGETKIWFLKCDTKVLRDSVRICLLNEADRQQYTVLLNRSHGVLVSVTVERIRALGDGYGVSSYRQRPNNLAATMSE